MDSHRSPGRPARRWPRRLVAVLWPLALAGAVALAIAESRTESPDARADRGRAESPAPSPSKLPRLVEPRRRSKPKRVRVPDVTGFRARMAERALTRRDLEIMGIGRESLLPAGTVVDQSPRSGKRVKRGARVRLYLASPATGTMPRVIGDDVVRAASDLWAVGLEVEFDYRRVRAPERDGTVLEQSPPTGHDVRPGQRVWLLVARR